MDTIAKVSDPVFNPGGVTTLLRNFSLKVRKSKDPPVQLDIDLVVLLSSVRLRNPPQFRPNGNRWTSR
jgi:hypothetical protein